MKAPFHLLYNNDTTNTAGVISPWRADGEPFREEFLVASIEEVAGKGVDAYMLSPGLGWVPWWQGKIAREHYPWVKERIGLQVEDWGGGGYDQYVYHGGDMVQVLIDTCRKHNMAPFASLRLNDVHGQENYNAPNKVPLVTCRLYAEHPEWHVDPDHPSHAGYYPYRGMNWAIPEVRAYKLELLTELAEKYDLAGLELDFLRDDHLFRDDFPMTERIELITAFVSEVRNALDKRTDKKRYLSVRIPLQLSVHARTGLDIERLYAVGVDMFTLSDWYHTAQRTDIAEARKLLPDASINLEMTHANGWYPYFCKSGGYGTNGDPRTSDHQFYTTANLAYARGADGFSLFNFVYYRMGHTFDIPVMEPPFHVLPKLLDRAFVASQSQYYMITGQCYHNQLPRELHAGTSEAFQLDIAPPARRGQTPGAPEKGMMDETLNAPIRLRIHTEQPLPTSAGLTASINGTPLQETDDITRFFGNPFDGMISPEGHRRAWIVPEEILINGLNEVTLQVTTGETVTVLYIDLGIPHVIEKKQ